MSRTMLGALPCWLALLASCVPGTVVSGDANQNKDGRKMTASSASPFVPAAELQRVARAAADAVVSEQHRQSLPVPRRSGAGIEVWFFFCPALALPGRPVQLGRPTHLVRLAAASGDVLEVRATTPQERAIVPREDPIGEYGLPPGTDFAQAVAARDRVFALLDELLPAFAAGTGGEPARSAAAEFRSEFALTAEPPLCPYYNEWAAEFLAWVNSVSPR